MVDRLEVLLRDAQAASPGTRISFRDDIAAYGSDAIGPMRAWLYDPRLGAFAVRVLQRIAADPVHRSEVLVTLGSIHKSGLAPEVRRDLDAALVSLRPASATGRVRRTGVSSAKPKRPTRHDGDTTEQRFDNAMLEIYWLAGHATGYWASYFLRAVRAKGGVATARDLLRKSGTSPGYARLMAEGHLEMSMEALVIDPEFSGLFTHDEVAIARDRLEASRFALS